MTGLAGGRYGCPMCNEPPPHSHDLGTILNARYYCPDAVETGQYEYGPRHQWGAPSRWLKRVHCTRCDYRQLKEDRPCPPTRS